MDNNGSFATNVATEFNNEHVSTVATESNYECMLTTVDNPFDPFEQFTSWWLFDIEKGYNSCSRLMRIANLSDDMSSKEEEEEIERAIDEIVKYDFLDVYKKVKKEDFKDDNNL